MTWKSSLCAALTICAGKAIAQGNGLPAPWTLESAIARRQANVVEMLLQLHVDPNRAGTNGDHPLDLAAMKGDPQIVRLLLSHGAQVNVRASNGSFPLHSAALAGNNEIVKLLLDRGADINCREAGNGETPLYEAASLGRIETVKLLLDKGADRNLANNRGVTPLAAAVKADQTEVANVLRIFK